MNTKIGRTSEVDLTRVSAVRPKTQEQAMDTEKPVIARTTKIKGVVLGARASISSRPSRS